MPRKNYDDYTKEEGKEFNLEVFAVERMLTMVSKDQIYGLKVIKDKAKSQVDPQFEAYSLEKIDLDEASQVFDEIFAPADAFHRKHGTTDLLDNFHGEKRYQKVRDIVKDILKQQFVDVSDQETFDKYCKAYILFGMATPKARLL